MKVIDRLLLYFLFIFALQIQPLLAQEAASEDILKKNLATVQTKIKAIKNKTGIDEALRLRILTAYYASEDNFEALFSLKQKILASQKQLKSLPEEVKHLQTRIEKAKNQLNNPKQENFSLYPNDELEQRLIIEKSKLNEVKSAINLLEIQLAEQLKRPQQIREKIVEIKETQNKTLQEQGSLSVLALDKQELNAHQMQLDSLALKLNATLTQLDQEKIVYPLKAQVQKLEQQLLNFQSKQLSILIKNIDDFLFERKQLKIEKEQTQLIEAEKEASSKHLVIQQATRENIRYNRLLQEFNSKIEQYTNQKSVIENEHKQLEQDFQNAEQKINLAGLSPALGNLLREQRRNLPLIKGYGAMFEKIHQEISLTSLELFNLDEQQKSLSDIDFALLDRMTKSVSTEIDEKNKLKIRTELRILLHNQKDMVVQLNTAYARYSRLLADVDFSLQQLVMSGEKYRLFLDSRLLWVPSAPVINNRYLLEIFNSILWFIEPAHWQQASIDLKNSIQNSIVLSGLGFVVITLLFWLKKTIKLNLQELLTNSLSPYADRFEYTFHALGYVFLLALPLPLSFVWLAWLLRLYPQSADFTVSIANALLVAAVPLFTIQLYYRLLKPKGTVQSLFYWQEHNVNLIYKQLKWLRFIVVPALFLIALFNDDAYFEHSYTLGRLALIIFLLALSCFFYRFAHSTKGIAKDYYEKNPNSWSCRLRVVYHITLFFIPLIIIGFAIAGYYQSALELQNKLVILIRLIFFTGLFYEIVMRWMVLTNRKLVLQNARQKRHQQEASSTMEEGSTVPSVNLEEEALLDIPKINEQSKKLLSALIGAILLVGSWFTLHDIFPAFSIFEQVVLWQHMSLVDGKELLQPITLINIFVCFLYLILMLIFIRNFPGLIDLLFAGQYSMGAGSRYALIQLTRYAVISLTLIAMANTLGGSWSQVQWLVAAVSVGLGFGLQEIFANMVSGVILLFERPIRVGDTVTVGDVTGTVCRIQMRATTITDWDQKELVVPNKTFITDKLINWSLTDTMTRIVIPVGVSYDSDEALAQRLLHQVIKETPLVLNEPEPTVYFLGFGESSLDFSLRVFVRDLRDRLPVMDELHNRIRRIFKANNIEIPFPQRDLHIRSSALPSERNRK